MGVNERALNVSSATDEDIDYPRDIYTDIIANGSPYAVYLFGWVDYEKDCHLYRLKMPHDIKLKDGTVHERCQPNGNGWYPASGGRFDDKDVQQIRLSKCHRWWDGDSEWEHPAEKKKREEKEESEGGVKGAEVMAVGTGLGVGKSTAAAAVTQALKENGTKVIETDIEDQSISGLKPDFIVIDEAAKIALARAKEKRDRKAKKRIATMERLSK